jgi:hypothetical protein
MWVDMEEASKADKKAKSGPTTNLRRNRDVNMISWHGLAIYGQVLPVLKKKWRGREGGELARAKARLARAMMSSGPPSRISAISSHF